MTPLMFVKMKTLGVYLSTKTAFISCLRFATCNFVLLYSMNRFKEFVTLFTLHEILFLLEVVFLCAQLLMIFEFGFVTEEQSTDIAQNFLKAQILKHFVNIYTNKFLLIHYLFTSLSVDVSFLCFTLNGNCFCVWA